MFFGDKALLESLTGKLGALAGIALVIEQTFGFVGLGAAVTQAVEGAAALVMGVSAIGVVFGLRRAVGENGLGSLDEIGDEE